MSLALRLDREEPGLRTPGGRSRFRLSQSADVVPAGNPSVRNGYRFAKYEGESIISIVEKHPKTAGFCDSARHARLRCSRSIHCDA
jgi:hypothetical protein